MLGRQRQLQSEVQKVLDTMLFCLALYLAHLLRTHWQLEIFGGTADIRPFRDYFWLFAIIVPAAPLVLSLEGFYTRPLVPSRRLTAWQALKGCAYVFGAIILAVWIMRRPFEIARSVIILFGAVSFVLILLKEEWLRYWRQSHLGKAQLQKRLILVGTPEETSRVRRELTSVQRDGLAIVAQLNINEAPVEHLAHLMHEHSANGVLMAAQHTYFGQLEQAIEVCEREGVEVWLLADFFKTQVSQTSVDDFYGRPMLVFRSGPETSWQALAKHVVDFLGASLLLLAFSVPLLLVSALIKLTSPGPVLFRQQRSGLNGRPFTMLKFRSMVTDAEQRKDELMAFNEMSGPVFKVTNDPRVTPVGRLLRRFSLDEWPQLVNVLRGEMSLVGPRPLPVAEVQRFDDFAHRRRLSVRPGLTCLWQISGRNEVRDFKEWVRLDLEYIDNWSFWLDLKILLRTIPVVLRGTGAK